METEKKPMLWQTVALCIVAFLSLIFIGGTLQYNYGLYGVLMSEGVLLVIALIFVALTKGSFKDAFRFKKPTLRQTGGALVVYFGGYIATLALTITIAYLLPEQYFSVTDSLTDVFTSEAPLIAFLIISLSPALCEESLFRGAMIYGVRNVKKQWLIIVGSGIIFGIFHTSVIRFFPTAVLGMIFAYVYLKTDNLIYPMLLHFINNSFSSISVLFSGGEVIEAASTITSIPLMSVGIYLIFSAAVPFIIRAGSKLFEPKKIKTYVPNAQRDPSEKKFTKFAVIFACCVALIGTALMVFDQTSRKPVIEMSQTLEVASDENEALTYIFEVGKDDIYTLAFDIKAQRGLCVFELSDEEGNSLHREIFNDLEISYPINLAKGSYTIKLYSHIGDLWDFCKEEQLDYTEEGDLVTLNMGGDLNENSEIEVNLTIK